MGELGESNLADSGFTPTELVYACLCPRKFWLFRHGIRLEREHEAVKIGRAIAESTYPKNNHELRLRDFGVVDSAVLKNGIIYETKKSSRRSDLDELQTALYLKWFEEANVRIEKAIVRYPKERKSYEIALTHNLRCKIVRILALARASAALPCPPSAKKIPACKSCAYYELCFDT